MFDLPSMIDGKPTPGPWVIERHGNGYALYSGRDNQFHGLNLVNLTEPDWNWEANARLIAAAPAMLEVLKEARAALDAEAFCMSAARVNATLARIDAALAKATGQPKETTDG